METLTPNYGLRKQDEDEFYTETINSDNMDILDPLIKGIEDDVAGHIADTNIHVTATKQATWNGKIDKSIIDAAGDLIYGMADNTPAKLAKGTARQQLAMNSGATAPEWVASLQSLISASGDLIYGSAANTPARLAKGTDGQALILSSGLPVWGSAGAKVVSGNYTGDGVSSRIINIGFTAKIVFAYNIVSGMCLLTPIGYYQGTNFKDATCIIQTNGFVVTTVLLNTTSSTYYYVAIG